MFVLGIDPGLSHCGYGLVGRGESDSVLAARAAGVIETDPAAPLPERLLTLHTELRALVAEFAPDLSGDRVGDAILFGMAAVRNVGESLVERIVTSPSPVTPTSDWLSWRRRYAAPRHRRAWNAR